MRISTFILIAVFIYAGCRNNSFAEGETGLEVIQDTIIQAPLSPLEKKFIDAGLTNVQTLIPEIEVELKYSTTDNFLKTDVYGTLTNAYLQPDVAEKLKQAFANLQEADSSLTFIIYDAARPLSVQKEMWSILDLSVKEKGKYLSSPAKGSVHNYGAAIDISLKKKGGEVLDMGTAFDYFGELAEPQFEGKMLAEGKLTEKQVANRKILRNAMVKAGFRQMTTEWWHYNSCSRDQAKVKYKVIE